jgi:hypothetical protein
MLPQGWNRWQTEKAAITNTGFSTLAHFAWWATMLLRPSARHDPLATALGNSYF